MAQVTPIQLAVVGHTNVGKTSLIRTLLQDPQFGQVDDRPGTTREVSEVPVLLAGEPVLALYDTPGLEDGEGLYTVLETLREHRQGPGQLAAFLAMPEAQNEFEQEAKVIRQLLASDAAFYIIDSRDPVLPRLKDELDIIRRCGKPVLPVLNFVATPDQQATAWQDALAEVNLHGWVAFDTCSLPEQGEAELLQTLQALLPKHKTPLQQLLTARQRERQEQAAAATQLLAELLLTVSAARDWQDPADTQALQAAQQQLQQQVQRAEQQCLQHILALYGFTPETVNLTALKIAAGAWQDDLFAPETWRQFGLDTSKGVVSGGAAGAAFDVATAGLSLGAGTVLGATAGGLWQGWRRYGKRWQHKWQGRVPVVVDEQVVLLIAARQLAVIRTLSRRGHGATAPVRVASVGQALANAQWHKLMRQARTKPEWSDLNAGYHTDRSQAREQWLAQTRTWLEQANQAAAPTDSAADG